MSYQRVEANQQAARTVEQFMPMIGKYTRRFARRAAGLNAAMDEDDIRQELSLIFLRCTESYDESKGGSFMNFVITAWFNNMNQLMRRDQRNFENGLTISPNMVNSEEEEMSIFDTIDSGWATPEENVMALKALETTLDRLSPQARVLVMALIDPPDVLRYQYEMHIRGIKERREAQTSRRKTYHNLSLRFLFEILEVPVTDQLRLIKEIEATVQNVFQIER